MPDKNFLNIVRKYKRLLVIKDAQLLTETGNNKIRVSNISQTGAKFVSKTEIQNETDVLFKMAGVLVAGKIIWVKGNQAGIEFYQMFSGPLF